MSPDSKNILDLLRADYPDLSSWTIICANERAIDPVQHLIRSELGGILPRVECFDSYLKKKISEKINLPPLPGDEQLLFFIQFIAERFPDDPYPARRAAGLLPVIIKLAQYNIRRDTIYGAERFTEEEWNKLDEFLKTLQDFRRWLYKANFFMPELETAFTERITASEKDLFLGLPPMTSLNEGFYRRIRKDRLFIDLPLFGTAVAGSEKLPFDSAKNLVLSFGGKVKYSNGDNIELLSLAGLHSLANLVTHEVTSFLKERSGEERLLVFLLDESLTPMLWNRSLRWFGNVVNLAVWLPFSITSAGKRLMREMEKARVSGCEPDFKQFAATCAVELSKKREDYAREECEALEAAISFSTLLDSWKEKFGRHLNDTAKTLIEMKKFSVTGSRSAPVQVVGFGDVSGERFSRGLILSCDSGVMPTQPFDGPFINPVHVPLLRKSVFEYEDLIFRQILALGDKIKITGIDDSIRERTPSYYMSLLGQEFGIPVVPTAFKERLSIKTGQENPAIQIDDTLRRRLKEFSYSYSSLSKIMACPFLFYNQSILKIEAPLFMDDDEKINMKMGSFVHKFLYALSTRLQRHVEDWEQLFDELWKSDDNAEVRDIPGISIHMLNAKIFLKEIYADEKESDQGIVFADNAIACEERFEGMIAGSYKITGRSDRIAGIGGRTEVIDFKYIKKQSGYELRGKSSVLERFQEKGILHPAAQLIIYQHFNEGAEGARFYFLKEPTGDREIALPEKEIAQAGDLMEAVKKRLDTIIGGTELSPNYDCSECDCCRFQALCGREGYYKALRVNR